ncbi:hypothetical protein G6F56_000868 [Rhizopus delemar]|nr:hypothetical protein G6F56_000868 [Rhizopus delemar]
MNNAPTHTHLGIQKYIEERNYGCIYLPPYFPELNPVEQILSVRKSKLKREKLLKEETLTTRIGEASTGEYTKAITRFSRIRKNRTIKPSFSPEPGINRAPADHLKGIFAGHILTPTPDLDSSPTSTSSPPFASDLCPPSSNQIHETLKQLPRKKAPGVDHIQTEMLLLLLPTLVPQLLHLFRVCWRVAQVVPIHKKGSKTDPENFRPISLTSTFRKLFEKCLYPRFLEQSPTLDIAQGGFRESCSSLDQVQCLIEISYVFKRNHNSFPTLALLDIKSAYDTVDRSYVWCKLQSHLYPALLGILKNLFDDVQIEIILDNRVSYRFSPVTDVLQGFILSPFLYSIYINRLPSILRQPLLLDNSFSGDIVSDLTPTINCLLCADDVVLIANPENLTALLHQCEAHGYSVGYRWNPLKCVIVAPNSDAKTYQLYGTTLPKESSFSYLGIHIKPGGLIGYPAMIQHNTNKASLTMNQLAAIDLSSKGFPPLLACHFYSQMIRAQLDYGLAISPLTIKFIHQLDTFQNQCIRRIFGGHSKSSAQIMLHLVNLPSMRTRVAVLQAQYLFRSINLPDDTLLVHLLPYVQTSTSRSHWYKLANTPMWKSLCGLILDTLDKKKFLSLRTKFLADQFQNLYNNSNSILLSSTRPTILVDPILWLPMTCSERSRVLRWRLGWLPGGKPKECVFHLYHNWSRRHAFDCLNVLHRLYLPRSIEDPISFLLNLLPLHKPCPTVSHSWFTLWPILCTILHELDYYFHDECPPPPVDPGVKLLNWLSK